jgi:hypothetical protein
MRKIDTCDVYISFFDETCDVISLLLLLYTNKVSISEDVMSKS